MYVVSKKKNRVLTVLSLLFIFQTILFAGNTYDQGSVHECSSHVSEVKSKESSVSGTQGYVKIVMNCFGGMSMTIMVLLTSLLGAFFVRDEFEGLLE